LGILSDRQQQYLQKRKEAISCSGCVAMESPCATKKRVKEILPSSWFMDGAATTLISLPSPNTSHSRHRVVRLDLRGHGQSDKPLQSYTMEAFADDVAWMCTELGLRGPVIIGHSMGSIVAFDLACRYPELPLAIIINLIRQGLTNVEVVVGDGTEGLPEHAPY
jgi:pimeloyl-ACP methyl ester carboxylesterase